MKKRVLLTAVLLLGVAVLPTVPASFATGMLHLKLDKSTPEADQVVTTAPAKIVLDFSEAPELAVTRVVVSHGEVNATLGEVKRDEEDASILWAAFEEPVGDGAYTVNWVTSSSDGHPVRGEFAFTVQTGR